MCTLSKLAEDTKLGGVDDMPEDCAAIQRDLNHLEKWSDRNLMKFNKGMCKILLLRRNNPVHQYTLCGPPIWNILFQKGIRGSGWMPHAELTVVLGFFGTGFM